jgi:hypothetical protein
MEAYISLPYLRDNRLVPLTKRIIGELGNRLVYPLNSGVFIDKLSNGKTWYEDRVIEEERLDGRYDKFSFEDQRPFLLEKRELGKPIVEREPPKVGLVNFQFDYRQEFEAVTNNYKNLLSKICRKGEDINTFGETTKSNAHIVLSLLERIFGLGPEVASSKIRDNPDMLYYADDKDIEYALIDGPQEERVISGVLSLAELNEIPNPDNVMMDFFKWIIKKTVEAEKGYVRAAQRANGYDFRKTLDSMTWCHKAPGNNLRCFGNK